MSATSWRSPSAPPNPAAPRVFVSITTHTTRHLAATLAGLAWQTLAPHAIAVSCDTDAPALAAELDLWWPRVRCALGTRHPSASTVLLHTFRPHQGRPRANQTRNNGLRALIDHAGLQPSDLIVILDGDIALASDALTQHQALAAAGAHLNIGYRVMLDEAATAGVTPDSLLAGGVDCGSLISPLARGELERRHARYRRNLFFSRFGFIKPHKPKIISCHFAVRLSALLAVNGCDEEFAGHRFDDDDLSRRIRLSNRRIPTAIAVSTIDAFHLHHPTRAFPDLANDPGYQRWNRTDLPIRAACGLDSPLDQPTPTVRRISP